MKRNLTNKSRKSRSRPRKSERGMLVFRMLLLILTAAALLFLPSSVVVVHSKEVEVTSEWTLLGENDTIPVGMHVRMDLTTGEKWVKLVDENDSTAATTAAAAEVQPNGHASTASSTAAVIVESKQTPEDDATSAALSDTAQQKDTSFDYEMMHRTLSKLPVEEQERMGGLPELPGRRTSDGTKVDPEMRAAFERRMKEIWTQRQEELARLQEELVADLPKLLVNRIERIQDYLSDPISHLQQMNLDAEDDQTIEVEDKGDAPLTHIVSVLQDLEYHLSDLDMTRDFHTLGGWPLLVALLSDNVHATSTNETSTTQSQPPHDLQHKVNVLQTHVAWAIGTAVKNHAEFFDYAVEEVVIGGESMTPLSLLLKQLAANSSNRDAAVQAKRQKVLYALGALLRGNRVAQRHFVAIGGPAIMLQSVDTTDQSNIKLTKRILALADDIVTDIVLHTEPVETTVIEAFSDHSWCQLAIDSLDKASLQETALRTVKTLAAYCSWDGERLHDAIAEVQKSWKSSVTETDPDHFRERLALIDSVLEAIQIKERI